MTGGQDGRARADLVEGPDGGRVPSRMLPYEITHHWVPALRDPVRFVDAVTRMRHDGATAFLELGPGDVLTGMLDDCLPHGEAPPIVLSVARNSRAPRRETDVA